MPRFALLSLFALLVAPGLAASQALYVEANARGRAVSVPLTPELPRQIGFVVRSNNREAQTLDFSVNAPPGTRVKVRSVMLRRKLELVSAIKKGRAFDLELFTDAGKRKTVSIDESDSPVRGKSFIAAATEARDPSCGCLTEAEIRQRMEEFRRFVPDITRERFCLLYRNTTTASCDGDGGGESGGGQEDPDAPADPGGDSGDSSPEPGDDVASNGSVSATSFLAYDKCNTKDSPAAIVLLDLSAADPAAFTSGEVSITATLRDFDGNKRASIKERGDGKYKVPLLLAGPVYGSFKSGVTLSTYNGRRRKRKNVPIADMVNYSPAGGALYRVPLGSGILRGGKGVFEIQNGAEGYSICAQLVARRQYFNGYTN